ncbi:MAG: chemotaxis protein CheX [Desulfobacteraceae bacterium]|nr:MAG: chemotaxis protein CheX [Desulfobacteraceae bacterium]
MDVKLVNPFIEGALHILDTTAFVKVKPDPFFIKKDKIAQGDISGVLDISGDVRGSASISFTRQSILGIVSAMFGEEMTELNEEISDAVGEISNMIAGHVTTKIGELDKKVKVKFIEVKVGKGHEIEHVEDGECVVAIPFKTTKGKVVIEVSYTP